MVILSTIAGSGVAKLLGAIIAAIVVVILGKLVISLVNKKLESSKADKTLTKFLSSACKIVVYFVAVMIVASALGFEMSSLVALASVVSAAFALAASGVLSNLFGGMLLLVTKPFGVGDYVAISGEEGTVIELGLLATKINTVDNKRVTIPNSSISSATIVNYSTEGKRRVDLVFNLSYGTDPEAAKACIRATAERNLKVIDPEQIFVRVSAYNDSNVSFTLRAWCSTADYWDVYFDLMEQVRADLNKNGINMVYPTYNVYTHEVK